MSEKPIGWCVSCRRPMFLQPDRGKPEVQALQTICMDCASKVAAPAAQRAWAKWDRENEARRNARRAANRRKVA